MAVGTGEATLKEPSPAGPDGGRGRREGLSVGFLVHGRPGTAPSRTALGVWMALAICLAAGAVAFAAATSARLWHQPSFVGFDEQAHLDYVVRLSHGQLPRWGDRYAPETVRMLDCLGIARTAPQPCTTGTDPRAFPPDGYSYEAQQPPLSYLAYVPFLRPHAGPVAALSSVRRGGTAWLVAGAVLLVLMAWLADMTLLQTTLMLTTCLLNPMTLQAVGTVTNDSAAIAVGAASVVAVLLLRRRRAAVAVPAALAVGVLIGLTKAFFLFAPVALLVAALSMERPSLRRPSLEALWKRCRVEICLVVGAGVSTVGFVLYQEARASVPAGVVLHALLGGKTTHLPRWSTLEASLGHVFSAFTAYIPSTVLPLFTIWGALVYGSAAGLLLNRSSGRGRSAGARSAGRERSLRALAGGTAVAAVAIALGFPLLDYVQGHFDYYTPSRYLLPLVPLLAFIVARALRPASLVLVGVVLPALAVGVTLFGPI